MIRIDLTIKRQQQSCIVNVHHGSHSKMAATRAEVLAASRIHSFPHERSFAAKIDAFQVNQMKNMEEEGSERGRQAQRGNVSRIKSMFQNDLDPKLQEDNRIAYNRNLGIGSSRSPEIKRKRADLVIDTNKQNSVGLNKKNSDVPSTLDTNLVDPQKFFESTSHVQRFQFTRAIFAQMEQKTKEEQKKAPVRKLSPNRIRAVSPTSPNSRSTAKLDHNRKLTHPLAGSSLDNLTKHNHRSTSDPSRFDDNREQERLSRPNIPNKPDYLRTRSTDSYKRAESLDRLDNDYTRRHHNDDAGVQNRNLDSQRNSMSRSDSDLTREFSTEQRDNEEAHVSTRYLRQRYEDNETGRSRSVPRSNRFTQQKDSAEIASVGSAHSSYMSDSGFLNSGISDSHSALSHRSTSPNGAHPMHTTEHAYSRQNKQEDANNHERTKRLSGEESSFAGRNRRLSQDEIKIAEQDHERLAHWRRRVNKPDPASSGVLLHKRRSREEKGLSKEEIEQSLNQADTYWQGKFGHLPETSEAVDQTNTMTDSTYSSGSGEEMARSESGHNLNSGPTSPLEPEVKRRSWGRNSPTAKRNSRNSDVFENKVAEDIVAQANKRNSQEVDVDDLTYRYSGGSDKFVEKAEEATGYHSTHSSEENAFSRSSSEQSVIKRMSYTSDDQEHNTLNAAPPPYPHAAVPGDGYNSHNIPSPPPYTSPNSTPRVGDGTGQLAPRIDTGVGGEGDGPYPAAPPMLKPNLGIRKVPSPNESIESMTLSEQEALLAKA